MNNTRFDLRKKSYAIFVLAFFVFTIPAFSAKKEKIDWELLAKEGTAKEIQDAFKKTSSLNTQVFGTERETFLMLVLENDRELEIVNICLTAESNIKARDSSKKTPIMYAAEYTSYPEVLDTLITSGTVLGIGIKARINVKDDFGKTPFDYALKNKKCNTYEILSKYAKDPASESKVSEEASSKTKEKAEETKSSKNETKKKSSKKEKSTATEGTVVSEFIPYDEQTETKAKDSLQEGLINLQTESTLTPEKAAGSSPEQASDREPVSLEQDEVPPRVSIAQSSSQENTAPQKEAAVIVLPAQEEEPEEEVKTPPLEEIFNSQSSPQKSTAEASQIKPYSQTYLFDFVEESEEDLQEENTAKTYIENPDYADENGVTLLMKAAKAGNDWDVQNLLESGANVQTRDKDGWSALMYAVRYQNSVQLVNMLIKNGAHIRVRNKYNATPLLLAADYSQNPQIISLLLTNRSASEDEVFRAFVMALTSNAGSDHVQVAKVKLFLDMGVPVNRMWKGETPLMYASQYSASTAVIKLLLENGAKTSIKDAEGKTAFDYAKLNSKLPHDDTFWALNSSSR